MFENLRLAASTTRQLAGAWARAKTTKLQAAVETPDSWIAGGGDTERGRWQSRRAKRRQLKEYHKVRQDGGIVATLLEARALMVFGPGGQFTSEDDDVAEWLNEEALADRDQLTFDIGLDTYFYGYSLGEFLETRDGEFSHVELIEPWTTVPDRDRQGRIQQWEQEIKQHGGKFSQTFDPDDIVHFKTIKASGRDRVGMSLLGRGMDEAKAYRDNQDAIKNAIQLQGYPKFHVKLGRDGGAVIDDNELGRARPMFDDIHEKTKWITGQDVDIGVIEAENFDFEGITEHDLSKLAIAFMLPVELTQIGGGDGLGTGFPAKLRRQLFLLGARSHQRLLGDQLVQQVGRPLLEEYAPEDLDADANLEFVFDDPITDLDQLDAKITAIGDDMTVNERRELFDLSPVEDDDVGESFESPADDGDDDGMGLFSDPDDSHALQDAGVASRTINWVDDYLDDVGTLDNTIADFRGWVEDFADAPGERLRVLDLAIGLFGEAQGIAPEQAHEQPVSNLRQWFERNRQLADGSDDGHTLEEADEAWMRIYQDKIWSDGTDTALLQFSDTQMPQFVADRMREAVLGGALFSDFEGIPDSDLMDLRMEFADTLTEDGWSMSELSDRLQNLEPQLDEHEAKRIARTETQAVVNDARERGYRERDDFDEHRFRWVGPDDHRTTEVCEAIKDQVPDDGLSLEELQGTVQETAREFDHDPRDWTPHVSCRHTYTRVV